MKDDHDIREPVRRSDEATAAIVEEALRLCASEGIDGAIRYMEWRQLDRAMILRVLCSPKFHRQHPSQ